MAKKKEEVEQAKTKKSENEPSSKRKTTQKKQAQYEFLDTSKDHSGLDKSGVTDCIKEQDKDVVLKKENGKKKKIIVASILSGALLAGAVGGGILLFSNKSTNLVYNVDGKRYELEIRNASDLLGVQAPKLEGYDFAGWYLDEACVQKIEKDQVFKNNTVVYPKYVPKTCDVEYLANDGTGESVVQDVVFNTEYNIADNTFTRENYIFMGWSTDADSHYTDENIIRVGDSRTLVTEGIKYYAIWKGVDRNITYSASEIRVNGEVYTFTNTTCPHGETYTLPTIEGEIANGLDFEMKFAGYIVDGQVYAAGTELTITEDVEITINWTDKDSVLYFNLNLPAGEMAANINPLSFENASQEYLYTDLPEPAALVNYEFKCWNTAIDGSREDYNVGEDFATTKQSNILYAIWEGKARTINLYNQGSIEETFNLKYGETINLPEYTLTDYTFIGFNDKSDYTGNVYTISLDILFEEEVINLYAQYERNQITITFNANGGEGTLEPIEVNTNEVYTFDSDAIELHRSSMIRQYYTFVGWSEDPNALTTEASFSVDVDEVGIVLYAIWEKQESQIMFEGENIETIKLSVSQGEKVYAPNLPSEQCYYDDNGVRYYFAGWSDTEGATKPNVYINETELTVEDALKTYHAVYMPASDCLEYTLDSNTDTYSVSFDTSSTITEEDYMLIIPNTYNGKDVTKIKYVYGYSGLDLIKRVIVADGVNISSGGLRGMSNLKSIKLPASFTSIEQEFTFYGLRALETIIVDDGNTKYDSRNNCNAIIDTATNTLVLGCKNTVIPEGVTSIGFRAFYETDGPSSIEIPASVTSIDLLAFEGCDELKTITFADDSKLTSIGDYAFRSCSSLTNMYIPASVTSIGDIFGDGLSSLESIIVEEGNTVYDSRNNCNALIETATNTLLMGCKNTVIPEGVLTIGVYALNNKGLTRVEIPASVTSIHRFAFSDDVLETIIVDEDNKTYDSRNNCNALIETATNTLLMGCKNTVIPEGVEIIGIDAFVNCEGLTTLEIPASVTSIEMDYGFYGCNIQTIIVDEDNKTYDSRNNCNALIETATNKLLLGCQNTVIPEGVEIIGYGAFRTVKEGLTTIEIPASVTSIGFGAFNGCNIKTVILNAETPINLGSSCLLDDATIIYVPKGTLDAYKAAYSDYADIIFEKE